MSHFYLSADCMGRSANKVRLVKGRGSKKTGLNCHVRGWNKGIFVEVMFDENRGKDIFLVYETGGSNNAGNVKLIAAITEE